MKPRTQGFETHLLMLAIALGSLVVPALAALGLAFASVHPVNNVTLLPLQDSGPVTHAFDRDVRLIE